tara:strand:- start:377 stop:526 length:150 start_codon:yes stop_codon:yes gene_type:complete
MKVNQKEEKYQLLADCIRSDQLSARQVNDHLESDPDFKKWYKKRYLNNK